MRTALMLEIHGVKSYKSNNIVPEMHLTHNNYGPSTLAFWPIIKKCVTVRGDAKLIQYPAYQLEAVANNFYVYSVYGENNRHVNLLKKLLSDSSINSKKPSSFMFLNDCCCHIPKTLTGSKALILF